MGHARSLEPASALVNGGDSLRLFVAVEVPEPHKLSIEKSIQSLRLTLPRARWTVRDHWHVTLKFLGEVAEDRLSEVTEIAGQAASVAVSSDGRLTDIGSFPNARSARVLWVGIEDPEEVMASLAASMEEAFGRAGFRQEGRRLRPHLTIARFKVPQPIEKEVESSAPYGFDRSPFTVAETVLFRSRLSPKGATYEALERLPLRGRDTPIPPTL